MSWKDKANDGSTDDDHAVMTLGDLRGGEQVVFTVEEEPETFDSEYGEGVRVDGQFVESDFTFTDDDGNTVREGDAVRLLTWSSRLVGAMADHDDDHGLVGDTIAVIKVSGDGPYDTSYDVESFDN